MDNWNLNIGDMFRTLLNDELKVLILYTLKDFNKDIKEIIVDKIDRYYDELLNNNEHYWYSDSDEEIFFTDPEEFLMYLETKNYFSQLNDSDYETD